jgi:hypothetical protein
MTTLAAARASRRKRSRANSSPRYRSLMSFKVTAAAEIDVERLVSDAHCTATQLDRFPVFARHQFIVLKSLQRLFRYCRLDRFFGSGRLAGLNPSGKTLAQQADRTKFHRSRKLAAAAQTGGLGLFAHGPNRPSAASNTTLAPSGAKSAGTGPRKLLSRCTSNCVFLYTTASNHVSEQNSNRCCTAASRVDNELRRWGGSLPLRQSGRQRGND